MNVSYCCLDLGSGYRGRVLVSMRVVKRPGGIPEAVKKVPINYEIPGANNNIIYGIYTRDLMYIHL